jgi:putative ABC transport system ATP-binding protein
MIDIDKMRYRWPGTDRDCLDINELHLGAGETLILFGPSGAGKSTLLGILAGVLLATDGEVRLKGTAWSSLSASSRDAFRAHHVGYIFQQFNLLPYLSVIDNVMLPCRFSPIRRERALDGHVSLVASAADLLRQVGLGEEFWYRPASLLSVGQQQRVAAARALIGRPEVIIADEPTSALDAALRDSFMALLLSKCREAQTTLVFVSHDERLSKQFDRQYSIGDISRPSAKVPDADAEALA